jgi:hypothetical protein
MRLARRGIRTHGLLGISTLALASLLIATRMWAQETDRWQLLEAGTVTREVDTRSVVTIESGQYRVWIRASYQGGTRILQQEDYDCLQRRWRLMWTVGYYSGGALMNDLDHSPTAMWKPAIPGSTGESELELVCELVRRGPDQPGGS